MPLSQRRPRLLRPGVALVALSTTITTLVATVPAYAAVRADLVLNIAANPTTVPTTGNLTSVDIALTNIGGAIADAPAVKITLPAGAGVAGEGPSSDSGWQCDLSSLPGITCSHAALSPGQSAAPLHIPVRLPAGNDGESVKVGAVASTTSPETSVGNSSGKVTITYDKDIPDLFVASSVQVPDRSVVAGDSVKFGISVGNAGSGAAEGVSVRVTTSAKLTQLGVSDLSDPSWLCTALPTPDEWDCVRQPLGAGQTSGTLVFSGRVADGTPGEVIPYAFALSTATPGDYSANNTYENSYEYSSAVLRGQFWEDVDHDGQRGPTDPALAVDATVNLVSDRARDVPLNADGSFSIIAPPGEYHLEVILNDATYQFTYANVGDDATDSDYTGDPWRDQVWLSNGSETVFDIGLVKTTA